MKFWPNRFLNVRFLYAGFYCIVMSRALLLFRQLIILKNNVSNNANRVTTTAILALCVALFRAVLL